MNQKECIHEDIATTVLYNDEGDGCPLCEALTTITKLQTRETDRKAWRLNELADAYGLSVAFLRKEVRGGKLMARKLGSAVIVLEKDLNVYFSKNRTGGKNGA